MALNFQAFVDDSLTPGGEFVLGGYVATAETWAEFAKQWEELLPLGTRARNGKYHFKMSEMAQSPERMKRVPSFYGVIEKNVRLAISCRINLTDFARARKRVEEIAIKMDWSINLFRWANPYYFVFRGLVDDFHRERQTLKSVIPLDETVDFIFDNRSEKSFILSAWDEYLARQPEAIKDYYGATPRFEDDQKFLPLQAADFWAWWVRKWYEEDAIALPDKMRNLDFGNWRGKKRFAISAFSYDEDSIVDRFLGLAFENIHNAQKDGEFIFPNLADGS